MATSSAFSAVNSFHLIIQAPQSSLLLELSQQAFSFAPSAVGAGQIGDRIGRQEALKLSVVAMATSTVFIAVLPTYKQIGLLAPLALIALRIIQGLSAGGEYTTSLVFLAEHARITAGAL